MLFNDWLNAELGRPINVDGAYGNQCVDVAMSFVQFLYPGHGWQELLGYGDAKDLFTAANDNYFSKINYSQGLVPQQGDMPVFGPTSNNPSGHIAVVISADTSGMTVIEQNGFNPSGVAYQAVRPYSTNLIGWLRPKELNMSTPASEKYIRAIYGAFQDRQPTAEEITLWNGRPIEALLDAIIASPATTSAYAKRLAAFQNAAQAVLDKIKALIN